MTMKMIDLNQIPEKWLELTEDGKVIIKDEDFAKKVKEALAEGGDRPMRNGGCSCSQEFLS